MRPPGDSFRPFRGPQGGPYVCCWAKENRVPRYRSLLKGPLLLLLLLPARCSVSASLSHSVSFSAPPASFPASPVEAFSGGPPARIRPTEGYPPVRRHPVTAAAAAERRHLLLQQQRKQDLQQQQLNAVAFTAAKASRCSSSSSSRRRELVLQQSLGRHLVLLCGFRV